MAEKKPETKTVVATEVGYYDDKMVQPGDELQVPSDAKAKWFKDKETKSTTAAKTGE